MSDPLHDICGAALAGRALIAGEALGLIPLLSSRLPAVIAAAGALHLRHHQRQVRPLYRRLRLLCPVAPHKTSAPVYPLVTQKALLGRARELAGRGVTRMGIVTSGAAPSWKDFEQICAAARRIRQDVDIELCASLGAYLRRKGQKNSKKRVLAAIITILKPRAVFTPPFAARMTTRCVATP